MTNNQFFKTEEFNSDNSLFISFFSLSQDVNKIKNMRNIIESNIMSCLKINNVFTNFETGEVVYCFKRLDKGLKAEKDKEKMFEYFFALNKILELEEFSPHFIQYVDSENLKKD